MISNIWNNSSGNKNSLIRDILNKSMINDIMDDNIDDLKESLINDTFIHSMKCKILEKNNNKGTLIKQPTIDKIISHPTSNNLKKSLINEKINQLSFSNILKESTIDNKKIEINDVLKKTIVCNILKVDTISNKIFNY